MAKLSSRRIKYALILGPSVLFLVIYLSLSVVFVNSTDQHLLTTNRELKRYNPGVYHRFINFVHEKMLFGTTDKATPKAIHHTSPDSTFLKVSAAEATPEQQPAAAETK